MTDTLDTLDGVVGTTVRPINNITPFTYRDGETFQSMLYRLRRYITEYLVPALNETIEQNQEWTLEQIALLTAYVDAAVQQIINDSIQVQDPVVAGIVDDLDSLTRVALDQIYAGIDIEPIVTGLQGRVTALETLTNTGRLSQVELDKRYNLYRNVKQYGAKIDGVTDDTVAILAALNAGPGTVFIPAGTTIISEEIKIPSNVRLLGAGMGATIIKASATMPRYKNVLTNASNNREYRMTYDENIYIADMTLECNYVNRPVPGEEWRGQAGGVVISTARHVVVERVHVKNAPLHCFAIEASRLPADLDASMTFYPPGPSYDITLNNCIGDTPGVDDCFTTHYSYDIHINDCYAFMTTLNPTSPGGQTGFEIDDGSWSVDVNRCFATAMPTGFAAKSHSDRPPTNMVTFNDCEAWRTGAGFYFHGGTNGPNAHTVTMNNCRVRELDTTLTGSSVVPVAAGRSIQVFGYSNFKINNFAAINMKHGGIIFAPYGNLEAKGLKGWNVMSDPASVFPGVTPVDAFIRVTGDTDVNNASLFISDVTMVGVLKACAVYSYTSTSPNIPVELSNVFANGDGTVSCVRSSFYSNFQTYRNIFGRTFLGTIEYGGGSGVGTNWDYSLPVLRGTGSPQSKIAANPGTLYTDKAGGANVTLWVKESGTGTTGWVAK